MEMFAPDLYSLWKLTAPYSVPLISILRHSNVNLDIIRSEAGVLFLRNLTQVGWIEQQTNMFCNSF